MGLPLTNASRLPEDNLPFNSDSEETIHPQPSKIKPWLTDPVVLRPTSRKAKSATESKPDGTCRIGVD
jgi:hypothetical protein